MQTRTKSAFLLLVVLALGILIGVLVSGALHNRRLDSLARMRTGPGIAALVERSVQPESEEQRAAIRQVMEGAAPRFAEVFRRTHEEMRVLSDSVLTELEEILNPDQMEALRRHMEVRMRRRGPPPAERRGRDGDRRGPRPGAPPPDAPPSEGPPE